ncbi:dephospho-CoA kinase [Citrobacter amalonaticus]|uniref:Dephospho-CoA kinase n=1 Tax=Citrobacter amalonaticus TaxID=35703 RepID=A0ABY0HUU4_CITAM|nr:MULTISPECIES: AAA family ATPase [Citrobacter]MZK91498.1 dephospho-CoA kinase [Citrobacter amalonaticus]MZK96053.1 dephospho-CoA kinase [Citrobacter amalonaticus]MZL05678.1 dephospho-CoA kinase [Citrobacter amalonaticus]MZL15925.1 dephospho-CoA kinase [Citrobacter amalonaticus]MZL25823.1 dephospho-CoA kinase [Citrobacter amalonaticus]
MDYRIGITGAQGSGKTTLAKYIEEHYGIPYVDAGVGKLMSRLGVKVGEQMPLFERLQVQQEIAKHIEMITRGVEGFVIDRTPADVMAYTLDLVGQTNEDRCIELALDIERFCHQTIVTNFNAIAGLRPGVELSDDDRKRAQRGSLDRLYVARIDALMCGELTKINSLPQIGDLQVFIIADKCRTVESRARSVFRVLDRVAENIERRFIGRVTVH